MERLCCKACGCDSLLPAQVELRQDDADDLGDLLGERPETTFFTCHVCGDNWLTVKETEAGACTLTFVHQMGTDPQLRRVAQMATPVLLSADAVEDWAYFLGEDEIDEDVWRDQLDERRRILRAACSN